MSALKFVFCLQACIFQMVYTQCIGPNALNSLSPAYGSGIAPYGPLSLEAPGLAPLPGSYGGAGVGDIRMVGELPVAGSTLVAGQVPILGAVQFSGPIPAAGIMAVTGSCACRGFDAPFVF